MTDHCFSYPGSVGPTLVGISSQKTKCSRIPLQSKTVFVAECVSISTIAQLISASPNRPVASIDSKISSPSAISAVTVTLR